MRTCLFILQHFGSHCSSSSSSIVGKRAEQAHHAHVAKQVQLMVALAAELIANLAFSAGEIIFSPFLMQVSLRVSILVHLCPY